NQRKLLIETFNKETVNHQALNLKLGLLAMQLGERETGLKKWQEVIDFSHSDSRLIPIQNTAQLLINLWQSEPILTSETEVVLTENLKGWFRDRALEQFYTVSGQESQLAQLQAREKDQGNQAILKLTFLSIIPILGGSLGLGLLLVLLVQWLLKKDQSLLATNARTVWQTPWDWEITWQVLAIGFLFLGQLGLPIILGFIKLDISAFGLRGKAVYVLVTYLAMTFGGLGVMFLSIKSFFPLPPDWFKFQWRSRWWLWGLGGYVIALPVVVLISLINQQIWQGQGGSNPLLFLALESQDQIVLAIFFFTASIAAPFYEEIMFRGFLLSSLTRYMSVGTAIVLSSFLFAIAHLNFSEVLPLMGLGIILGIVYTRTRNLLTSMLLHCLWNSGTLVSLFILGSSQ
ncbi:MAG: lysostaphin resistance A-like protein, partial [Microcystaceae cyanobacterium]